ncbi:hypothetical protein LJC45_02905 [Alistipes sp. OttesenSCG-928-B03]|nr:hypothetical protein [Alistipes sp. OttesenSCG-928-B03]
MDEISDILIIAMAVLFSIISAVTKSIRKKAEAAKQNEAELSQPQEEEWPDLHEQIRPQDLGRERWEEPLPEEITTSEPWSYDSEAVSGRPLRAGANYDMPVIEVVPQQTFMQTAFAESASSVAQSVSALEMEIDCKEQGGGLNEINSDELSSEFISGFNIRDAVIYSEIFKPKFEE